MARWVLSPYVGDGSPKNEYRPRAADGNWTSIDLSPPSAKGVAVVRLESAPSRTPVGVVDLGDDLDTPMPRVVSRLLEGRLGVTLTDPSRLRSIIVELLALHGREDGTRWRRLRGRGGRLEVWCGELVYAGPDPVAALYTESFNQADSTVLGPDLTWTEIANSWDTVSNRARPAQNNKTARARAEHDLATDNHYVQAVVNFSSVSGVGGVGARWSATATTLYRAALDPTGRLDITKIVSGAGTDIASQSRSLSANVDYLVRLECDGSTIRARVDSDPWLSVTDTAISGYLRFGLAGYRTSATIWHDNVEAGDLSTVYSETLNVQLAAAISGTDAATGIEVRNVTILASLSGAETVASVETVDVPVVGSVDGTDGATAFATLDVGIAATVNGSETALLVEPLSQIVLAAATGVDTMAASETGNVGAAVSVGGADVAVRLDTLDVGLLTLVGGFDDVPPQGPPPIGGDLRLRGVDERVAYSEGDNDYAERRRVYPGEPVPR